MIACLRGLILALTILTTPALHAWGDSAIVSLKKSATVDRDVVVLGDIAEITASSAAIEDQLKRLDLLDRESSGNTEVVSGKHVQARVLLAGINREIVTVIGADECHVAFGRSAVIQASAEKPADQGDLKAQAVELLAKAWLTSPDDVEVQFLASPAEQSKAVPGATAELELPDRVEPGRIQAKVRWISQGRIARIDPLTFEAKLRQTIVLASHRIERGAPLTAQDIVEDRRLMSTRVEQIRAEQVIGLVARRGLSQGDRLTAKDLALARSGPVIQARNGVKVVARKGRLSVTLQMAEALEPGNVGDVIRLRNLQSGQIINGKVVSSQEVEIPLD